MHTFSFHLAGLVSDVVFRDAAAPVPVDEISGFVPTSALSQCVVIADEHFNIGDAWYCTDSRDGKVQRISPEYGTGPEFVNSNIEAFKESLRAAAQWSSDYDSTTIKANPGCVDVLAKTLNLIDNKSLASPETHWAIIVDHIRQRAADPDDEMEFTINIT
jgi:hypothetical protein